MSRLQISDKAQINVPETHRPKNAVTSRMIRIPTMLGSPLKPGKVRNLPTVIRGREGDFPLVAKVPCRVAECNRVLKDGAPVLLFTDWRQLPLTTDALQCAGFTWRGVAVWDKTEGVRAQLGRFRNQAEYVVWGSKGNMPLGWRAPVLPGVIRDAVRKADEHHMTGKPADLMRQLVRICEEGGRILDPFAGSGTTLLAADLGGFGWTGVEMTGHFHEVAKARLVPNF